MNWGKLSGDIRSDFGVMMTTTKKFRTCNLCEAMCGLEFGIDIDDAITHIRGDKNDPFSRGHICPKAVALQDLQQDPDRLRKPVVREGTGWREVGWDEAFEFAARGIRDVQDRHGTAAVGAYLGNPNVHNTGAMLLNSHLLKALKTPNIFSATSADQLPHHLVAWQLFGHQMRIPVPDLDRCDHFVVLGANPMVSKSNGGISCRLRRTLLYASTLGGSIVNPLPEYRPVPAVTTGMP